jgi:ech hydrogenase subunit F
MSLLRMSKTIFKNLAHGPYTVLYPVNQKKKFERTRGKVMVAIDDCLFCGLCQRRCPTGAISVDRARSSWNINRLKCIQCNYCGEVCPKKCLKMNSEYTQPSYSGVKDEYIKCTNTQSLSK